MLCVEPTGGKNGNQLAKPALTKLIGMTTFRMTEEFQTEEHPTDGPSGQAPDQGATAGLTHGGKRVGGLLAGLAKIIGTRWRRERTLGVSPALQIPLPTEAVGPDANARAHQKRGHGGDFFPGTLGQVQEVRKPLLCLKADGQRVWADEVYVQSRWKWADGVFVLLLGFFRRAANPVVPSPDRQYFAYVSTTLFGNKAVVYDGVRGPKFHSISPESLLLSPDGRRFAYVGQRGNKSFVVKDGIKEGAFNQVSDLVFSPEGSQFAYPALREIDSLVVVDGKEGPEFETVLEETLCFSPDGKHFGYAACRGEDCFVTWDGQEGPPFDFILPGTLRARTDGSLTY